MSTKICLKAFSCSPTFSYAVFGSRSEDSAIFFNSSSWALTLSNISLTCFFWSSVIFVLVNWASKAVFACWMLAKQRFKFWLVIVFKTFPTNWEAPRRTASLNPWVPGVGIPEETGVDEPPPLLNGLAA